MRLGGQGGDKIIIKRNSNGHSVFFSVRDDGDNGTIIDFIQKRQRLSLGGVRKELRPWIGRPPAPRPAALPRHGEHRERPEKGGARVRGHGSGCGVPLAPRVVGADSAGVQGGTAPAPAAEYGAPHDAHR